MAILHGNGYIFNASAFVQRQHVDASPIPKPPGRENDLAFTGMSLNVARGFSHHDAELTQRKLVKAKRIGHRNGLPTGFSGLRHVFKVDWYCLTDKSHYFHLMAVMVVPMPGFESISKSCMSRLLPPRPKPRPDPLVYPSFNAKAKSGMPGP